MLLILQQVNKLVEGKSALHFAVEGGHVPALKALLEFKPDVNAAVSVR